ncbi:hypothetical protein E2562_037989 [Oryza meyeriana var. granulata]|uniref:DUF834 domain-containing protein n=1 Tax=Oryza meyeriana var. granulata TaxID=110450 RepID=A0A6G1FGT1_9ORYZ|nr:hypothetical protein E2562_037989 [Oryza meyeriana var. granulata]
MGFVGRRADGAHVRYHSGDMSRGGSPVPEVGVEEGVVVRGGGRGPKADVRIERRSQVPLRHRRHHVATKEHGIRGAVGFGVQVGVGGGNGSVSEEGGHGESRDETDRADTVAWGKHRMGGSRSCDVQSVRKTGRPEEEAVVVVGTRAPPSSALAVLGRRRVLRLNPTLMRG